MAPGLRAAGRDAGNEGGAAAGGLAAGQDAQGGRLARAVGAQESEALAARDA